MDNNNSSVSFWRNPAMILKSLQLIFAIIAIGLLSDIFDDVYGDPDSFKERTNYGVVLGAFGITAISLALALARLERQFQAWKIIDVQMHAIAGVALLTGWILLVVRVNDFDKIFRENDIERPPIYKKWLGKAVSALVFEALIIPMYFIIPFLKPKVHSIENENYVSAQQLPPTTFYNQQQQQRAGQGQQQPTYGYYGNNMAQQQQQPHLQQQPKFYNQQGPVPQQSQGYYNYGQQQSPNTFGNPGQYRH